MILSKKAGSFTESVIREMTRLSDKYNAINLSQGFPDFPAPPRIKQLACKYITDDFNQYPITFGELELRKAITEKYKKFYNISYCPEEEITICCGATEAMVSSLLAIINPGDEIILFEPFYENYWPDTVISGAKPKFVTLRGPHWRFDRDELRKAFTTRTKGIIINTPNNPTGKVFDHEELGFIAKLCKKYDAIALTDEIYEHIVYNGKHIPIATLEGMKERTITISGCSKTFSVTGWRIGYSLAPREITDNIRKFHDFLTVGAPTPFQWALADVINTGEFYDELADIYRMKKDLFLDALKEIGFRLNPIDGSYYVMADFSEFADIDDREFAEMLIKQYGVAVVPGTSFYYKNKDEGRKAVRFCFCKKEETLKEAIRRLKKLKK